MKDFFEKITRKKVIRKQKPVYQFDIEGKFIYKHRSLEIASENLFIKVDVIRSAISRKSFCKGQWYFSRSKNFVRPGSSLTKNPLLTRGVSKFREMDLTDDVDF